MRRLIWGLGFLLLFPTSIFAVDPIPGDINLDGSVDFADFHIDGTEFWQIRSRS